MIGWRTTDHSPSGRFHFADSTFQLTMQNLGWSGHGSLPLTELLAA